MTRIPAVCQSCGFSFPFTGVDFGAGFGSNVTFTGNVTNCPRCGGTAAIADFVSDSQGNVRWLHGVYSALIDARASREQMRTLIEALTEARDRHLSQAQTVAQVEAKAPELAGVMTLIKPQTPADFWGMMGVLLGLLYFIVSLLEAKEPSITVDNRVEHQVNNYITQVAPIQVTPTLPRPVQPKRHRKGAARKPNLGKSAGPQKQTKKTVAGPSPSTPRLRPNATPPARTKGWKNARCSCGSGKRARECPCDSRR
jgi:hypothetical protein